MAQDKSAGLRTKIFSFTDKEEEQMSWAIKDAKTSFEEKYGKGKTRSQMVDLRYYAKAPKGKDDSERT